MTRARDDAAGQRTHGSGAGVQPDSEASPVEILAKFARTASRDAPQGTLIVDGHEPLRFAGWLDLMAIVEQILEAERQSVDGDPPSEDAP